MAIYKEVTRRIETKNPRGFGYQFHIRPVEPLSSHLLFGEGVLPRKDFISVSVAENDTLVIVQRASVDKPGGVVFGLVGPAINLMKISGVDVSEGKPVDIFNAPQTTFVWQEEG